MLPDALSQSLAQINDVFSALNVLPNTMANEYFNDLRIGCHLRHIYDHVLAVKKSENTGVVDYNLRNRCSQIECDRALSHQLWCELMVWCQQLNVCVLSKPVKVVSEVNALQSMSVEVQSQFARELLYLINHSIHHLAYIKLLLQQKNITLPDTVGLAPSTATYLRHVAG